MFTALFAGLFAGWLVSLERGSGELVDDLSGGVGESAQESGALELPTYLVDLLARLHACLGGELVVVEGMSADPQCGEDALAILRSEHVDWLLTDIRLPGLVDGWIVGSEFTITHPLRPVIYISGTQPDSSRRPNGSLFLFKPVDASDLIGLFHRLGIRAEKARGNG